MQQWHLARHLASASAVSGPDTQHLFQFQTTLPFLIVPLPNAHDELHFTSKLSNVSLFCYRTQFCQ